LVARSLTVGFAFFEKAPSVDPVRALNRGRGADQPEQSKPAPRLEQPTAASNLVTLLLTKPAQQSNEDFPPTGLPSCRNPGSGKAAANQVILFWDLLRTQPRGWRHRLLKAKGAMLLSHCYPTGWDSRPSGRRSFADPARQGLPQRRVAARKDCVTDPATSPNLLGQLQGGRLVTVPGYFARILDPSPWCQGTAWYRAARGTSLAGCQGTSQPGTSRAKVHDASRVVQADQPGEGSNGGESRRVASNGARVLRPRVMGVMVPGYQ
jgi:hypothetical protein